MSATTQCPHCAASFNVPETAAGRAVKCKKCGQAFTIVLGAAAPARAPAASPPAVRPSAVPPPPPVRRGAAPVRSSAFPSTAMGREEADAGLYRCGNKLVVELGADFPPVCVKTNEQAATTLTRKMSWHPPAVFFALLLGLIPYVIIAIAVSKKATLEIPVSDAVQKRRKTWLTIGLCMLFGGIAMVIYGGMLSSDTDRFNDNFAGILILGGFGVLFIDLFIGFYVSNMLVRATRIDNDYIWLSGVNKEYLARLPEF